MLSYGRSKSEYEDLTSELLSSQLLSLRTSLTLRIVVFDVYTVFFLSSTTVVAAVVLPSRNLFRVLFTVLFCILLAHLSQLLSLFSLRLMTTLLLVVCSYSCSCICSLLLICYYFTSGAASAVSPSYILAPPCVDWKRTPSSVMFASFSRLTI